MAPRRATKIVATLGPASSDAKVLARMIEAADSFPMNLAFAGKGNASQPDS